MILMEVYDSTVSGRVTKYVVYINTKKEFPYAAFYSGSHWLRGNTFTFWRSVDKIL